MVKYPTRSPFFAHKAFRLMHKTALAADIGRDAFCIIAVILHTEDAARYRGPVRFFNSQLQETLGFTKWDSFNRARQKAIDSGWLQYKPSTTRGAGLYFVTIPKGYESIDDAPIEHLSTTDFGDNCGDNSGDNQGDNGGDNGGDNSGIMRGNYTNPNPNPNPNPKKEPVSSKQTFVYSDDFESFWKSYPAIRRTQKKKAFSLFQKALKHVSAETIIKSAVEYSQSDAGSSQYAVGAIVFLGSHMWEDDRQAWSHGKSALTTEGSAATPPKLMSDPDRLTLEQLFTMATRTNLKEAADRMAASTQNSEAVRRRIACGLAQIKEMGTEKAVELIPSYGTYLQKGKAK